MEIKYIKVIKDKFFNKLQYPYLNNFYFNKPSYNF